MGWYVGGRVGPIGYGKRIGGGRKGGGLELNEQVMLMLLATPGVIVGLLVFGLTYLKLAAGPWFGLWSVSGTSAGGVVWWCLRMLMFLCICCAVVARIAAWRNGKRQAR